MPTGFARPYSRVALIAFLGALFFAGAILLVPGSSSADDASLKGITTSELAGIGLEVTVADRAATIGADAAEEVALEREPGAKIMETRLVNYRQTFNAKRARPVWVVNMDPAGVEVDARCPIGFMCPAPQITFTAAFVDANTGELISFESLGARGDGVKITE
jgi:hypothetical protein